MARQIAVQSQTTCAVEMAHSQALQYNMLTQNCYSSWFDIPVAFYFIYFLYLLVGWIQSEGAVLVDPLEALRVLHSHEEFLSQVFK